MLSIGTAGNTLHSTPDAIPKRGIGWAKPALDLAMFAQEQAAEQACQKELGGNYLRLDAIPGSKQADRLGLDVADAVSTTVLLKLANARFEKLAGDANERSMLFRLLAPVPTSA
jgi:hypothetical protein